MEKLVLIFGCIGFCFLNFAAPLHAQELDWENIGRANTNVTAVLLDRADPKVIYMGSGGNVLKTEDGADSWRVVLSVKGGNRKVNFLAADPRDKNALYAATGNGLFYSKDKAKSWKRIFQGKDYLENECTAIAIFSPVIYLGTRSGLFLSRDNGRNWQRQPGKVGTSQILAIAYDKNRPGCAYVACADGVFKATDSREGWALIFSPHILENDKEQGGDLDEAKGTSASDIRHLEIDCENSILYLATYGGIYKSIDQGKSWDSFCGLGLLSKDVQHIFLSRQGRLYAASRPGIFEYRSQRWQELSLKLSAQDVRVIACDELGNIYAGCDTGLFKARKLALDDRKESAVSAYLKHAPDIREIQQVAVDYAEVQPEKIKLWRKQAARKALFPQVSVGIDRNTTDLWHWEGGSTTKTDDDILRRGRDSINWDVTLSWDLGEIIWNGDQTSIDSRSKLMVELRDNILDEVTRLYFERLRVQMELDNLTLEDRKKRLEKELRLRELGALLDGLSGGYFSRRLEEMAAGH